MWGNNLNVSFVKIYKWQTEILNKGLSRKKCNSRVLNEMNYLKFLYSLRPKNFDYKRLHIETWEILLLISIIIIIII